MGLSNYSQGHEAEKRAAEFLEKLGFKVVVMNWRTRLCEIDIVAQKNQTISFVEVKYRRSNTHGTGLDYVTPKKLQQMQYAAESWVHENKWKGDYQLAAIEMTGDNFTVLSFVENTL